MTVSERPVRSFLPGALRLWMKPSGLCSQPAEASLLRPRVTDEELAAPAAPTEPDPNAGVPSERLFLPLEAALAQLCPAHSLPGLRTDAFVQVLSGGLARSSARFCPARFCPTQFRPARLWLPCGVGMLRSGPLPVVSFWGDEQITERHGGLARLSADFQAPLDYSALPGTETPCPPRRGNDGGMTGVLTAFLGCLSGRWWQVPQDPGQAGREASAVGQDGSEEVAGQAC